MHRHENVYTIDVSGGHVPTDGHLPLAWGSVIRADQKVCDFDSGIEVCLLEKLVDMG